MYRLNLTDYGKGFLYMVTGLAQQTVQIVAPPIGYAQYNLIRCEVQGIGFLCKPGKKKGADLLERHPG